LLIAINNVDERVENVEDINNEENPVVTDTSTPPLGVTESPDPLPPELPPLFNIQCIKQIDEYFNMTKRQIIEKEGPGAEYLTLPDNPYAVVSSIEYLDLGLSFVFDENDNAVETITCHPWYGILNALNDSTYWEIMERLGDTRIVYSSEPSEPEDKWWFITCQLGDSDYYITITPHIDYSYDSPMTTIKRAEYWSTHTPEPEPGLEAEPLKDGEIKFEAMSVNDVVAKYGKYNSYRTGYSPRPGTEIDIDILYDDIRIVLKDINQELSFTEDIKSDLDKDYEYYYSENAFPLTEIDRALKLEVSRISWNDKNIIGIRDIKIGDSVGDVRSKFLDRFARYNNGHTVYSYRDLSGQLAENCGVARFSDLTYYDPIGEVWGIDPDFTLSYQTGEQFGTYVSFMFKNSVLFNITHSQFDFR